MLRRISNVFENVLSHLKWLERNFCRKYSTVEFSIEPPTSKFNVSRSMFKFVCSFPLSEKLPSFLPATANLPLILGQGVMEGLRVAGGGEVEGQEDGNISHQPLQQARAGAVVVVQGAQWRTDTVEDVVGIDAAEAVLTEDMPGENEESDNQEEG